MALIEVSTIYQEWWCENEMVWGNRDALMLKEKIYVLDLLYRAGPIRPHHLEV